MDGDDSSGALATLRGKLLKLLDAERRQSSFRKKVEKRRHMTSLVVGYCRGECFERKARQLSHEVRAAESPSDYAYALFYALQNIPDEDGGSGDLGDRDKSYVQVPVFFFCYI